MVSVIFADEGINYNRRAFTQWDYGQKLEIIGLELAVGTQVHFARKGSLAAVRTLVNNENGYVVHVPNAILEHSGEFTVYLYEITENEGKTTKSITFEVTPREKPEDYISSEQALQMIQGSDIETRLSAIEDAVSKLILKNLGVS